MAPASDSCCRLVFPPLAWQTPVEIPPWLKEGPPLPKRRPSRSFAGAELRPGTRQLARELRCLGQIGYQLRHHFGRREDTRVVLDLGIHHRPGRGIAVRVAEEVAVTRGNL